VSPVDPYLIGGMDFGVRSPTVMLWAKVTPRAMTVSSEGRIDRPDALVEVIAEYAASDRTLEENLRHILAHQPPPGAPAGQPRWVGADPAGFQRSAQTGVSDIAVLRKHGLAVRTRHVSIAAGVERICSRLDHQTLRISSNCPQLIDALAAYHFDFDHPENELPVKDGPDHLCDALRYLIVNLDFGSGMVEVRRY